MGCCFALFWGYFGLLGVGFFEEQRLFLSKPRHMSAMVGNLSKLLSGKGERLG